MLKSIDRPLTSPKLVTTLKLNNTVKNLSGKKVLVNVFQKFQSFPETIQKKIYDFQQNLVEFCLLYPTDKINKN